HLLHATRRLCSPHAFPTRRSSDLRPSPTVERTWEIELNTADLSPALYAEDSFFHIPTLGEFFPEALLFEGTWFEFNRVQLVRLIDRKSTRLNSSHVSISYAVFCLK